MKRVSAFIVTCLIFTWTNFAFADSFSWPGAIRTQSTGLHSTIVVEQIRAIQQVSDYPLAQIEPLLLPLLKSKSAPLRRAAANALVSRKSTKSALPVSKWLALPSSKDKILAAQHLRKLGDETVLPALIRTLDDKDNDVLVEVLNTIAFFQLKESNFAINDKLDHSNPNVRRAAANAMLHSSSNELEEAFTRCLDDSEAKIVAICIEGLHGTNNKLARRKIIQLTQHKSPSIRHQALGALGTIDSPTSIHTLFVYADLPDRSIGTKYQLKSIGSKTTPDSTTRKLALKSLVGLSIHRSNTSPMAAMKILNRLVPHLEDRRLAPTMHAALKPVQRIIGPLLIQTLMSDSLISMHEILDLIAYPGHEEALSVLYKELELNRAPKAEVFHAIAKISSIQSLPFLLKRLGQKNTLSKTNLLRAVRNSVSWGSPGSELLTQILPNENFENKKLILESLKTIRYSPNSFTIEKVATDPFAPIGIRILALETLSALNTCSNPTPFFAMLENETFRRSTSQMLIAAAPESMSGVAKKWIRSESPFYAKLGAKILLSQELLAPKKKNQEIFEKLAMDKDPTSATIGFAGLSRPLSDSLTKKLIDHAASSPHSFTIRLLEASYFWTPSNDIQEFIQANVFSQNNQTTAAALYALSKHKTKNLEEIVGKALKSNEPEIAINGSYAALKQNITALIPTLLAHPNKWVRFNGKHMSTNIKTKNKSPKHQSNTTHAPQGSVATWHLLSDLPIHVEFGAFKNNKKSPYVVSVSPTDGAFSFRADNDGRFFRKRPFARFTLSTADQTL